MQKFGHFIQIQTAEQLANGLGSHFGLELVAVLLGQLAVSVLREQFLFLQLQFARVQNDVTFEVEDFFKLLERHVQQNPDPAGNALQKPDMGDGGGQLDMAHAFPPDLGLDHLDPALVAHDSAMLHSLILAAITLPVLDRTENPGAEETVAFRLE